MESRRMVLKNLFTEQQWRNRDIENRPMDMGNGEERVRCMKRVTWKPTLLSTNIVSQREFVVWLRKLKQGLCVNLELWYGG